MNIPPIPPTPDTAYNTVCDAAMRHADLLLSLLIVAVSLDVLLRASIFAEMEASIGPQRPEDVHIFMQRDLVDISALKAEWLDAALPEWCEQSGYTYDPAKGGDL